MGVHVKLCAASHTSWKNRPMTIFSYMAWEYQMRAAANAPLQDVSWSVVV